MKKILLISLAMSVTAALLLGGPSQGLSEKPAKIDLSWEKICGEKRFEGVDLNVPTIAGWRSRKPAWDRAAEFTEKTGATFTVQGWPHVDVYTKMFAESLAGTGALDFVTGLEITSPLFQQFAIPLNDYIERDFGSVEEFKKLFYPGLIDYYTYDGKVKFIPYHYGGMYIVYRKKLFEDPKEKAAFKAQYGYELAPPKTRQQLIDIAKFFTRPEEELWGLVVMGKGPPGGFTVLATIMGAGYNLLDSKTGAPPFKEPEARKKVIEAVSLWDDLIRKYKVMPPGTAAVAHTHAYEMFVGGHAAMSFGWYGDYEDRLKSPEIIADIGEVGNCQFPIPNPEKGGLYMVTWGWGIHKDCKNPDAAWEFIKWTISRDIQLAQAREAGTASPIMHLNKEAAAKGWIAMSNLKECERGYLPRDRSTRGWDIIELYWTQTGAYLAGDLTPEEYVDALIEGTEKIME